MSDPLRETEQFVDLQFPLRGLSLTSELQLQPELTTTECSNVRGFEALSGRGRGGTRPGLAKQFPATIAGGALIQHLDVIVDPQAGALLIADDIFNDPFNPDSWQDITDNPIGQPIRNPTYPLTGDTRWVRFGGSGLQPNRNIPTRVIPETTTVTVGDDLTAINVLANDSYDGVPVIALTGHQWVPNGVPKVKGTAVHNGSIGTLARLNYTPPDHGDGGEARLQYRLSTSATKRAQGYSLVIVQPLRVVEETTTVSVGDSATDIDVLGNDWWPRTRTPTISDAIQVYTPAGANTTPGVVAFTGSGAGTRLNYTPPATGDGGVEIVHYRMTISGGAGFADGFSRIVVQKAGITFVQAANAFFDGQGANVLRTAEFDNAVVEGNLLIAVVVTYHGADVHDTEVTVKNDALANYTQVGGYARSVISGGQTEYATSLWYRVATASAAENAVQVRADFFSFVGVALLEYRGAATVAPLDGSNSNTLSLASFPSPPQTITAGVVPVANPGELVILASGGATGNDASANTGFVERVMVESGVIAPIAIYVVDKTQAVEATEPTIDAASPTNQYAAIGASFKPV